MNTRTLALLLGASLCFAAVAQAQTVTFESLPQTLYALDLSPDGRWMVGLGAGGPYLYDTVEGTITFLPPEGLKASAVSDDGTVVLGCMDDPDDGVEVAGIWTEATGWESLGWLPDALNCPSRSNGYELSADGSIAVGLSWDGCSGRGFVWSERTGMLELEPLANGGNRASVVSADGAIIGGFAQGVFSRTPAMWDGVTTNGELLDPPDGEVDGEVTGISDDGSTLLGYWDGDAYMWTADGGVEIIGSGQIIPNWVGVPTDIADNGTIVGFDSLGQGTDAWIKTACDDDLVSLAAYVAAHGGGNVTTGVATRISADGRTIIGHTVFDSGWIIRIEFATGDVDGDGSVGTNDLILLLGAWGKNPGHAADFDGDGAVGTSDLIELLGNWGPCAK